MGRVKLPIKKIDNNTRRHVTFSKRRNGLFKKAYELAVLCDIDIGLVIFSPSGRLSHFSGRRRIEDVLERYINLPDDERGSEPKVDKAFLASVVSRLRCEGDGPVPQANSGAPNPVVEKLKQEFAECQQQLQFYTDTLSLFEPNPIETPSFTSLASLHASEEYLKKCLAVATQKKQLLMADTIIMNPLTVNEPSCLQPQEQGMLDHFLPPSDHITFSNQEFSMQKAVETFMSFRDPVMCDPSNFQMDPQPGEWQQMILAPTFPLQQTPLGMPTPPSPKGAMMNYSQTAPSTMPQLLSGENVQMNSSQEQLPSEEIALSQLPSWEGVMPQLPSGEGSPMNYFSYDFVNYAPTVVRGGSNAPAAVMGGSDAPVAFGGWSANEMLPNGSINNAPAPVWRESADELLPGCSVREATNAVIGGSDFPTVVSGGSDASAAVRGGSADELLPNDFINDALASVRGGTNELLDDFINDALAVIRGWTDELLDDFVTDAPAAFSGGSDDELLPNGSVRDAAAAVRGAAGEGMMSSFTDLLEMPQVAPWEEAPMGMYTCSGCLQYHCPSCDQGRELLLGEGAADGADELHLDCSIS